MHSLTLRTAIQIAAILVWMRHFGGAARTFSRAKGELPSRLIYCFTLAIAIMIFGSFKALFERRMVIPGLIGLGGSIALFEWARQSVQGKVFSYIFSNDIPEFLWTSGPFAYIRNPFYASYLLSYFAAAIMFPGIPSLVVVVGMTIYFNAAARHEERKFERSPLAKDYAAYRRRTGRFIPRLRRSAVNGQKT
jgi:protein-S-isoprenylcysteine O-methyltransferase Ste14